MATKAKRPRRDTYFELVRAFPLRRLKSASDHAQAMSMCLRLSRPGLDAGARKYLEVLVDSIAEYEKRAKLTFDTSDVTAADLVRHRIGELGLSVSALARELGLPQPNLADMLNGRRDWSKDAIRALSKRFDIPAERFLM